MSVKLCGYKSLKQRNIAIVDYMLETDATTRQAGSQFGISKTTVENACYYVMDLGRRDKRYSRMARDIKSLFRCHQERALFPKAFWRWSRRLHRKCQSK